MSDNNDCEYTLTIKPVQNGFTLTDGEGKITVVECREDMTLWEDAEAHVNLLWEVIDYFGFTGNKFGKKQVVVHIEAGRKYELRDGEKWKKEYYHTVVEG